MDLRAPTWYELIDDAAEKINNDVGRRVLTILPGVEISCTGIHILAIFPPTSPRRSIHFVICQLLNEIGFDIEEWGKNPIVGKRSVIDATNLIVSKGGIPIPAHIDGSDQALLRLHKLTSGAMKNIIYNEKLSAVEIVNPSKFKKKDRKLKTTLKEWIDSLRIEKGLVSISYLQGSDAHDLKNIGRRFTLMKMTEPSFHGLENSICIPSTRIRISDGYKPVENGLFIYGLELNSKLFGKRFLRFNRHLNCITGKKETGKTSIFQLMQSAVNETVMKSKDSAKLFVEKIENSKLYYYCFSREGISNDIELYSINRDNNTAKIIDRKKAERLAIKVNFYDPRKIDEIISSRDKLQIFLIKHFGVNTKEYIKEFNKMFSTSKFLNLKKEELLTIKKQNNILKLYLNINWKKRKPKRVEFHRLNNSLRRAVMIIMIIMNNRFGPVIIDAPEYYLDNEDISNFLIPIIKKNKDNRQIIFFTANPIIAVNSDPENYMLLESSATQKNKIISGFSIDKEDKKNEVISILEGGVTSYDERGNRYNLR
ncbi:MAG: hypothetical protein ACC651_08775 [Candidatus Scalindua sp.]